MHCGSFLRVCAVTFVGALAVLTGSKAGAQSNALFTPLPDNRLSDPTAAQNTSLRALQDRPTTGSLQLARVNASALSSDTITIPLPDIGSVEVKRLSTTVRTSDDFSWSGDIPGGGSVSLVVQDGNVTGSIRNGLDLYRVTPVGDGIHALSKVDQSRFPPDHSSPPPRSPASPSSAPDLERPLAGVEVDILVPYTASARAAAGGTAAMNALIQLAIDESNQAYTTSNANVSLRLVGTMEIAYTETSFNTALTDLQSGTIAAMQQVHAQRDAKGADLVALLINISSSCGLGYVNSNAAFAFSAIHYDCATGNYSFGHEIGHNFGALHDPFVDQSNSPFPYGHGFVKTSSPAWRTIMAYADACGGTCPRIRQFSNPNVTYNGVATGTVAMHDVARVHRERVATVAAFRAPAAGVTTTIVAAVLPNVRTTFFPGGPAVTGYATILNTGSNIGTQCSVSLPAGLPATFHYQRTNAQNTPVGTQDTPVDIGAGQGQTFVFSLTPTAQFSSDIPLQFKCTNSAYAPTTIGVNTFLVSVSASQISDMLSIADTPTHDGITNIPGVSGTGLMVTAAVNIGANATVTCAPTPTPYNQAPRSLAATLSICQTNPSTGACINPSTPGPSSTVTVPKDQTVTFSVFVTGQGQAITFDPALRRVFFLCMQGNIPVGEASVAVRTQ